MSQRGTFTTGFGVLNRADQSEKLWKGWFDKHRSVGRLSSPFVVARDWNVELSACSTHYDMRHAVFFCNFCTARS